MTLCVALHHLATSEQVDADRGELCHRDSTRLRDNLGDREAPEGPHGLAWAYAELVVAHPLVATPAPSPGGSSSDIDDHEAERLAGVLGLRDDIRVTLAGWVDDVADRTRLHPPTGRSPRDCQGWLLRHIASVEAHHSVAELLDETSALLGRAHGLVPWRAAPSHVEGIPCRCGVTALYEHPEDGIRCWACGATYTRQQYDAMTRMLAAEHRSRRRSA